MELLIGLGASVALLFYWLSGHWFARVLMTPVLILLLGGTGALLMALLPNAQAPVIWLGAILGAVAAWFVAGLPSYPQRKLDRLVAKHLAPPPGGWRVHGESAALPQGDESLPFWVPRWITKC